MPFLLPIIPDSATNDLADRVIALNGASDATAMQILDWYRFYDTNTVGSGTAKYNTIMNAKLAWSAGGTLDMSLHASNGSTIQTLFLSMIIQMPIPLNISKVGTGNNTVSKQRFYHHDYYHDGSSNMDAE